MLAIVYNLIMTLLTEINECTPNPCENNGTCNDLVNGYKCACTGGYTGSACEIGKINYETIYWHICHT
jgi:Notch-like protein